jgi:hypothetical protein
MDPLTLHFEVEPGTDLDAAAAAFRASIAGNGSVEVQEVNPQRFQAIGPGEIIAIIALLPSIPQGIAAIPGAIKAIQDAWAKIKPKHPGLHTPSVEVGLRNVPIDELREEDLQEMYRVD